MPAPSSLNNPTRKIQVLSPELADQIAAGEVVERPASVVKELIENALDAQADRIRVEIERGGKELIRVTDNGIGMDPQDAELAFARHATSKIAQAPDLEEIRTLGFRGEALPSIASIARVRLSTARDEREGGTEVSVVGGGLESLKAVGRSRGTTVEVAQLFFNTPARKKFLKGDTTEFSHITQGVTQQALAHPRVHFTLIHNGRQVIDTLPTGQLIYRIAELFGTDLARELVQVNAAAGDYRLTGYVSTPVYTRSSRSHQYCFINGRPIRDRVLLHATQQGYSHLLPKGQHAVLFLMLSMNPKLLDVNVHPSKAEVRFAFQQEVYQLVRDGVKHALAGNLKTTLDDLPLDPSESGKAPAAPLPTPGAAGSGAGGTPGPGSGFRQDPVTRPYPSDRHEDLGRALSMMVPPGAPRTSPPGQPAGGVEGFDRKPVPVSDLIYSEFEPLGQLNQSFIILQGPGGILLVDQHIAHERVLYERFRNAARHRRVDIQHLLFPVAVEFSPSEAEGLRPHLDRLRDLGLELEPFGPNGYLLRSVPSILKNSDHEKMLREVVDRLPRGEQDQALETRYEEIIIMMACRNAIKINQPLGPDQIRKLISDLEQTEMPYTCPHGRPIALLFAMDEILKKFLRK